MLIFALILLLCSTSAYVAQKSAGKSSLLFIVATMLAVMVPAGVAGLRGIHCGVDILVYCKPAFDDVSYYDIFWKYHEAKGMDLFFAALIYWTGKLSGDFSVALYNIALVVVSFFYIASYKSRREVPMWITYSLLMIGYYALSFNLMRQCMAIAFLMIGYTCLLRGNKFKNFILYLVISYFFHKTAVFGGSVLLFIHYASTLSMWKRIVLAVIFVASCVGVLIAFKMILSTMALLGGRFESYEAYGGSGGAHFKSGFCTVLLVGDIMCMCLAVVCYYMKILTAKEAYVYGLICVASVMAESLGIYTYYATRNGMYFAATQAFYLPMIATSDKLTERTSFVAKVVVVLVFIAIWVRISGMMGGAVPYSSSILDI